MSSDERCINNIRCLCADVVQGAKSGHPGAPLGMAPVAHVLFTRFMNFDSSDPLWWNRDRFILSNGHGCALLYSMLHLCGYPWPLDELKRFRQLGSMTPGHPERAPNCPGVEVTTGPLGQGISQGVGIAMAQEHLAARFNKPGFPVFDHYTYIFCGDGCLQEGVSCEATSLAGHLGLGRLIVIYDDNEITIDGPTNLSYSENVAMKFEALGWHTVTVKDGNNDLVGIQKALEAARAETGKPSMIILKTTIGYGSKIQGTAKVHGAPLGDDDIKQLKHKFGFDPNEKYMVEEEVQEVYNKASKMGKERAGAWRKMLQEYQAKHPAEHRELTSFFTGALPEGWKAKLPISKSGENVATRKCSENVLTALMPLLTNMLGGSADLTPSNLTKTKGVDDMLKGKFGGRYIRFGVREHAMCAIGNGLSCYGGLIPFVATFFNFIGYAWGAVRLGALSHCGTIYVATHDSIGVGEDGPTHQPVELPALCRATPNLLFFRPADQTETSGAYAVAIERRNTSHIIALSRQGVPMLDTSSIEGVAKGGYVVYGPLSSEADVIIIGTGTEVALCIEAAKSMTNMKVTVVSMPCTQLFDEQDAAYKSSILPPGKPIMSVEVYLSLGWERYSHYHVGMQSFGASAPAGHLYKHFGFTKENIAEKAAKLVAHFKGKPIPSKIPLEL